MGVEKGPTRNEASRFKKAEQFALGLIEDRFDGELAYHNTKHTSRVIKDTGRILTVMNSIDPIAVPKIDILRGRFVAAFHDVVQEYDLMPQEIGDMVVDKIERHPDNEAKSAFEARRYMATTDLDPANREWVHKDIMCTATLPDSVYVRSFYQPNLYAEQSFIGLAVALADLGVAGMHGPADLHEDGVALFREQFVGVADLLGDVGLTDQQKKDTKDFMLAWLKGQIGFAKGREARTGLEVGLLPEDMRGPVWELFPHFQQSIIRAERHYDLAQEFSLRELATFFGYDANGTLYS